MDLSIHYNSSWGIISSNRKIAEGKLLFFLAKVRVRADLLGTCTRQTFFFSHSL